MLLSMEGIIKDELSKHFDKSVDIKSRIRVISDLYKFNFKEDISVWGQKRGKVSRYYAVYFDDEFVVGFDESDSKEKFLLGFWVGLKLLIKNNKITLDKFKAEQKQVDDEFNKKKIKRQKQKRIDNLPESTPEEKLAKEAVKRVSRKKKSHSPIIASGSNN